MIGDNFVGDFFAAMVGLSSVALVGLSGAACFLNCAVTHELHND